jgi:ferric-dicitrate binding protein FerR (iron transport regulator)
MSLQEAKQFVARFIIGDYTPEEYEAFLKWLKGATIEDLDSIADEHEAMHDQWVSLSATPSPEWTAQLEQKLDDTERRGVIRRFNPERFIRRKTWVAAASVIVLLSAGVYLYVGKQQKVLLHGTEALKLPMTTYENPRGGDQKELILADGSKVWLNAASSLKFPSAFAGPERVVELSGEAFFEVAKNSNKPFRVMLKDAAVEVLGTHFNIMAYEDESTSKTTLIDGSVRMESGSHSVVLKPGEQAEIPYPSTGVVTDIVVKKGIDPNAVLAWKEGYLKFKNDDLHTVMRAMSRAYDVDIQVDPNVPAMPITGNFSRQSDFKSILKQLKSLGIHFKNDGKTVRVTL